jgi:hypothetical protein
MKKFGGESSVAGVAINPLYGGEVLNTWIKAGPGSVSANPMPPPSPEANPMPPPRGIVINNGVDSKIDKKFFVPSVIELPDIFYDALTPFYSQIADPFDNGGDVIE